MNLLKRVRDRLGLSPAATRNSDDQWPSPMARRYGFEAYPEGDEVYIRLEGEIDVHCALEVQEQLLQAFHLGPGAVHLDLRGISFMDSHGFWLMSRMAKRLRSEKRLVSCVTNQRIGSFFRMCELAVMLNVTVQE